jgi:AcrR family transcriptional regulator
LSVTVPQQARARKTFDAILDAAASRLREEGIEGLNTNSVASIAGVNIATLYRYFDDKYDLVDGLLTRFTDLQLARIATEITLHPDPKERLGHILDVQLQMLLDHPWLAAVQDALRASPRLQEIRQRNSDYMEAMVGDRFSDNTRGPHRAGERQEPAMKLLVEIFGSGLALVAAAPPRKRKLLMQELKTLLNAYLDTMPS